MLQMCTIYFQIQFSAVTFASVYKGGLMRKFSFENIVNCKWTKTNFHMKGFALELALRQAKGNSEIAYYLG